MIYLLHLQYFENSLKSVNFQIYYKINLIHFIVFQKIIDFSNPLISSINSVKKHLYRTKKPLKNNF